MTGEAFAMHSIHEREEMELPFMCSIGFHLAFGNEELGKAFTLFLEKEAFLTTTHGNEWLSLKNLSKIDPRKQFRKG